MVEKYGRFVRLWGIQKSDLPSADATPVDLKPFLTSILLEAIPFTNDLPPASSPWKSKGTKSFSHSTAPVQLYERVVSVEDLQAVAKEYHLPQLQGAKIQPETWVLRRSLHEDATATGTASWGEFVRSFKEEHAEVEKAFTPTVVDTKVKQQWDCSGVAITMEGSGDTWEDLTLKLEESVHKLPAPLKKRVFPVLQVTASARGRRDFIVVQIAARDPKAEAQGDIDGNVRAVYTSVERVRETASSEEDGGIEWTMGTVSDARGVLPSWMQKMAVPGQVAKDVDMFLAWMVGERKKSKKHAKDEGGAVGGSNKNGVAGDVAGHNTTHGSGEPAAAGNTTAGEG